MIVTLTPNPSIDRTVSLPRLTPGGVNRAERVRQDPGGKGVNVSRALRLHGIDTLAVMPLGGSEGASLAQLLNDADVPLRSVPVAGSTRVNLTLAGLDGVTTKVNEPGPLVPDCVARDLIDTVVAALAPGDWILGAGSLPPEAPTSFFADLVDAAHTVGAHVAIDSSGAPFAAALRVAPDLVKPNHHELGEVVGRELTTLGDVVDAARELNTAGVTTVIVSLGGSGAMAVTSDQALHATASKVRPVSTVGAGDALLAGYLSASTRQESTGAALELGVRFGTAAVTLDGSLMPTPDDIAHVSVTLSDTPDLDISVDE